MELGELSALLTFMKDYPEVKVISYAGVKLEFDRAKTIVGEQAQILQLPIDSAMPPDSAMLFASTPFFDEMMKEEKDEVISGT